MGMIRGRRFLELVLNNWVTTSNPFRMQGNFKSTSVVLAVVQRSIRAPWLELMTTTARAKSSILVVKVALEHLVHPRTAVFPTQINPKTAQVLAESELSLWLPDQGSSCSAP